MPTTSPYSRSNVPSSRYAASVDTSKPKFSSSNKGEEREWSQQQYSPNLAASPLAASYPSASTKTPRIRSPVESEYGLHSVPTGHSYEPHIRRQTYPDFLTLSDTAVLQVTWAFTGLKDAFRWDRLIRVIVSDEEIRANIVKSFLLNLVSLASIYIFDLILLPLLHRKAAASSIVSTSTLYQFLWLLPVMGSSLYLNGIWCTTIANKIYTLQYGRQHAAPSSSYSSIITAIATSAYRMILIATSIVLSFLLSYVPFIGKPLSFLFVCWVDSYYCFEFVWQARGLSLPVRVRYLEERWSYFLGFGIPITAVCVAGNSLANAALFALLFPAYIILACMSSPVPQHPYTPAPPTIKSNADAVYPLPNPLIPVRLPIFKVVIWINELVVHGISIVTGGRRKGKTNPKDRSERWEENDGVEDGIPNDIPLKARTPRIKPRIKSHVD